MQEFAPSQDETRGNPIEVRRPSFHSLLSVAGVLALAAVSVAWVAVDRYEASHALVTSQAVSVSEESSPAISTTTGTVKQILVKPGDQVKAGQLVAIVSDPQLEIAAQKAQQDLADAQKQSVATQAAPMPPTIVGKAPSLGSVQPLPKLPVLKAPANTTAVPIPAEVLEAQAKKDKASGLVRQLESTVQVAATKVSAAKMDLAAANQEAEAARAPVEELQNNLDLAKTKRDKYQSLYSQGIISRVEFQNTQADVDAAQTALDEANKQVADTAATVKDRQADLTNDQALLAGLQGQLTAAQKAYEAIKTPAPPAPAQIPPMLAPRPATETSTFIAPQVKPKFPATLAPAPGLVPLGVAFSPTAHVAAQDQVLKLKKVLDDTLTALKNAEEVRAATDGVVGTVSLNARQMVNRGDTILTIARPETTQAVVALPHTDALRVKKGEQCQLALVANPQAKFSGIVTGFKTPEEVEVKITGNPQGLGQLPAGTPLSASIDTRSG